MSFRDILLRYVLRPFGRAIGTARWEPHAVGSVHCVACGHRAVAVVPASSERYDDEYHERPNTATYYSVIQYVPDPVINERINVGIVAYSNGIVRTRFLNNWERVKALWHKDALTLKQVAALFIDIDQERIIGMARTWHNSIQLTAPNASLGSLDQVVSEAANRFLIDPPLPAR